VDKFIGENKTVADDKKDALLAQIRFAYKKPIVLGQYPQKETENLEYWIDRFIDEEVSQYGFANIEHVFSNHQRAIKVLLLYLEDQGVIADSGVQSEEKEALQAMLKA
jgi:hypothetical protein